MFCGLPPPSPCPPSSRCPPGTLPKFARSRRAQQSGGGGRGGGTGVGGGHRGNPAGTGEPQPPARGGRAEAAGLLPAARFPFFPLRYWGRFPYFRQRWVFPVFGEFGLCCVSLSVIPRTPKSPQSPRGALPGRPGPPGPHPLLHTGPSRASKGPIRAGSRKSKNKSLPPKPPVLPPINKS